MSDPAVPTHDEPIGRSSPRSLLVTVVALLTVLLAGCGATTDEAVGPALDLDTLTVEVPGGTLEAAPVDGAFVGPVDEGVFAAVVIDEGAPSVHVYLCDGDTGVLMEGTPAGDQVQLIQGQAQVELDLAAAPITGAAVWDGQDGQPFSVAPATGDAGFYWATGTVDGRDVTGAWIVLEDGRQRGYYTEEEEPMQM